MRASQAGSGHKSSRISGVSGDQAVSGGRPAICRRIVFGTFGAAASTLDVKDGAAIKYHLVVPATVPSVPAFVDLDAECTTSLVVTPSSTAWELTVIWD
jgi:hypothetical protein